MNTKLFTILSLIILFLTSCLDLYSQNISKDKVAISIIPPELYTNYPSDLKIEYDLGHTNYRVEVKNAEIKKDTIKNSYILTPDSNFDLNVGVYLIDNQSNDTFLIQEYDIKPMPRPEIYWGDATNGELGSRSENILSVKYPNDIPFLKNSFTITSWSVEISGQKKYFSGNSNILSAEVMRALKKTKTGNGKACSITCAYSDSRGILRQGTSVFLL